MDIRDGTHWRDSARSPRFFMIDARAAFPLVFFLLAIHWWTFFFAIGTMIFFALLSRYGFTVPVFWRWLQSFLAGPHRVAREWWKS